MSDSGYKVSVQSRTQITSQGAHTELQFSCPDLCRRVRNKALGEIALDTANHVMIRRMASFADDTESVVFHQGGTADASKKPLLHSPVEPEDGDLGRGDLYFDGDLSDCNPRQSDSEQYKYQ